MGKIKEKDLTKLNSFDRADTLRVVTKDGKSANVYLTKIEETIHDGNFSQPLRYVADKLYCCIKFKEDMYNIIKYRYLGIEVDIVSSGRTTTIKIAGQVTANNFSGYIINSSSSFNTTLTLAELNGAVYLCLGVPPSHTTVTAVAYTLNDIPINYLSSYHMRETNLDKFEKKVEIDLSRCKVL